MTTLSNLPAIVDKRKKRVGRGYGSGRGGHTVGRGQKGQNSRNRPYLLFEGVKTQKSLLHRLPLLRGKGKLKSSSKPIIVNVRFLNLLPKGTKVTIKSLAKYGLIKESEGRCFGVKVLGAGKLEKALTVALPCSSGAKKKIEKAGGTVIEK